MRWNLNNIRFLYPPDDFPGHFTNEKMQARHEAAQKQKIDDISNKLEAAADPLSAMLVLNKLSHIHFLQNNLELFKEAGSFEKAVVLLYYRKNTPFVGTDDLPTWIDLFNLCEPEKLSEIGSPLPQDQVTGYRGSVTGISTGLSWTTNHETVAWILDRWKDKDQGGGTVFALEISRDDVLVYITDEEKQEVILKPKLLKTIEPKVIDKL